MQSVPLEGQGGGGGSRISSTTMRKWHDQELKPLMYVCMFIDCNIFRYKINIHKMIKHRSLQDIEK